MKLKSYFNPTTRVVEVRLLADAAPAAPFVVLGDLTHEETNDNASGMQKHAISHVIYQHVQEALYKQHQVQDMQRITIKNAGAFRLLESLHVDAGQTSVKPTEKITIKITPVPANATVDGYYVIANDPSLVTITDKTGGVFEAVFASANNTILRVGVKNANFEQLIPIEALETVRQA